MKTDRRKFISSSVVAGLGAAASPLSSIASAGKPLAHLPEDIKSKYAKLDAVLKLPVLKKELFPSPVIIVPTGPGLGIRIDPDYVKTHKVVKEW